MSSGSSNSNHIGWNRHGDPNDPRVFTYLFCTCSHYYFRMAESVSFRLGNSRVDHKSAKLNSLYPFPANNNSRFNYNINPFLRFCHTGSLVRVSLLIAFSPHSFHCRNNLLGRFGAGYNTVDSEAKPLGIRPLPEGFLADISARWRARFPTRTCPPY